jgi:hypothetical protein
MARAVGGYTTTTKQDVAAVDRAMAATRAPGALSWHEKGRLAARAAHWEEARERRPVVPPISQRPPSGGLRAHSLNAKEVAAVIAPPGRATVPQRKREIVAEIKQTAAQFHALSERWSRTTGTERESLLLAMSPLVKRDQELRREFAAALPPAAQQLSLSFGR